MNVYKLLLNAGKSAGIFRSEGSSSPQARPAAQVRPEGMSFAPAPGASQAGDAHGTTRFATLPKSGKGHSAFPFPWGSVAKTLNKGATALGKSAKAAARQFGHAVSLEDDRRGARRVNEDGYDESDTEPAAPSSTAPARQSMFEQVRDNHARQRVAAQRAPVMKESPVDRAEERGRAEYHGVLPDYGRTEQVIDRQATAKRDAARKRADPRSQSDTARRRSEGPKPPRMHMRATTRQDQIAADCEAEYEGRRSEPVPAEVPDEARYAREMAVYKQALAALDAKRQSEQDSGVKRAPDMGELATRVKALDGQRRVKVSASSVLDRDAAKAGRKTVSMTDFLASQAALQRAAPSRRAAVEDAGPSAGRSVVASPAPERLVEAAWRANVGSPGPHEEVPELSTVVKVMQQQLRAKVAASKAKAAASGPHRDAAGSSAPQAEARAEPPPVRPQVAVLPTTAAALPTVGTEPDRSPARSRTRALSTRLDAPRPEERTRALNDELATRVADTFRVVPLEMIRTGVDSTFPMIRSDVDPRFLDRFARLLTNGTPYEAKADKLASEGRLGTQFGRRLSHLAEIAEKRGVGLEELLRKQPVAVLDYVIDRDYRGLGAALKATKNPVTQASTASTARETLPLAAVAPAFKRELRTPAAAAQELAAIEKRMAEMRSHSTELKATSARLTQEMTASDARLDSLLAAAATQLERDDRDALKAMKERMTRSSAAANESMQALLASAPLLKATTRSPAT